MHRSEYLEHFDRETDAFVAAAEGKLDRAVPSCPGWTVAKLANHVWGVINFWPHVVLHDVQDPSEIPPLRPKPSRDDLLPAIRRDKDQAIGLLRHTNLSAPMWNWSNNKTVSFVPRRLANEMSIHRWDVENAADAATPIPEDLARDGVDEFIDVFIGSGWPTFRKGKTFGGETIKIEQLAPHRDWTIQLKGRSALVAGDAEAPDLTVRGRASDLVLMFWRRGGRDRIELEGSEGLLDRFLSYEEPPDD